MLLAYYGHAPSHTHQPPWYLSRVGKHVVSVNLKIPIHEFSYFYVFIRCRRIANI